MAEFDPRAIRQILQARQMGVEGQQPPPIDPAALAQFAPTSQQPVPDMPIDPTMNEMPELAPQMDPAVQLEMQRQRVKESLKQVRDTELQQEIDALIQARQAEINEETQGLFNQGK